MVVKAIANLQDDILLSYPDVYPLLNLPCAIG